jgi:hypothetical protein
MVPEQRQQNDERQRHAQKPKQNSSSQSHGYLLIGFSETSTSRAKAGSIAQSHSRQCCGAQHARSSSNGTIQPVV